MAHRHEPVPRMGSRPAQALWLLAALLLVACGAGQAGAPAPSDVARQPAGKAINVVTTMSILTDMVEHVGGDRVAAENIIPVGAGPEDYQPTPQDAQRIAAADIVFYNGHGLEE